MMLSPRILSVVALSFPLFAHASNWRSELYPENWTPPAVTDSFETEKVLQDFSYAGYKHGEESVPEIEAGDPFPDGSGTFAIFDVTDNEYGADGADELDDTLAIQAAIDAAEAAGGGIVYLPAGLYHLSKQAETNYCLRIDASNIIFRGAGKGETFLLNTTTNMRDSDVIQVEGVRNGSMRGAVAEIRVPWFRSYTRGVDLVLGVSENLMGPTRTIPVDTSVRDGDTIFSEFDVGDWVIVVADIGDDWINEHEEPDWLGEGSGVGVIRYQRQVTAVDPVNQTIEISSPTRYYLKTRDNARIFILAAEPTSHVGLEDFSIGNVQNETVFDNEDEGWGKNDYKVEGTGAHEVDDAHLIQLTYMVDSWVDNIDSFLPEENTFGCHLLSHGILLEYCSRITVSNMTLQKAQYGGGGGNGYMFRVYSTNDSLFQDCHAAYSRHGFSLAKPDAAGNVFHRCSDSYTGKQTRNYIDGVDDTSGKGSDFHMYFSHSNLFDVCSAHNSWYEARYREHGHPIPHNITSAHSVFWNTKGTGGSGKVVHTEQARYGYAIGTRGTRTGIQLSTKNKNYPGTYPIDHREGQGIGDTLQPFSLYEDQLKRRLGPYVILEDKKDLPALNNSARLSPSLLQLSNVLVDENQVDILWEQLQGPSNALITTPNALETTVVLEAAGEYVFRLNLEAQNQTNFFDVKVTFNGLGESIATLLPQVTASGNQSGFVPENVVDSDLSTRWSSEGTQEYLEFDLREERTVEAIHLAIYNGHLRDAYFSVEVSMDGSSWIEILDTPTTERTQALQSFDLPETTARYVRLNAKGNSVNDWNSYFEVRIDASPLGPIATASEALSGHVPSRVLDGSRSTRWSSNGKNEWIQIDLRDERLVEGIQLSFYQGQSRYYLFSIDVSLDGSSWQTLIDTQSQELTEDLQHFDLPDTLARYVRINTKGSVSGSNWNGLYDVIIENSPATPELWIKRFGVDPAYATLAADPDGDGISNLGEYILNTDPTARNRIPMEYSLDSAGKETIRISVNRSMAEGPYFVVECSDDLKNWHLVPGVSVTEGYREGDTVEMIVTLPQVEREAFFYRVKLSN